jgi:integrase
VSRPAKGHLETYEWADGATTTYRGRVRYQGGQARIVFGTNHEGWSEQRALNELERIVGQIARGTWTPPDTTRQTPVEHPADVREDFRAFLYRWWQAKKLELTARGRDDYLWRIGHLNAGPLATTAVGAIDRQAVDAEKQRLQEHGLGARATNMVLMLLAQVLDYAVDYGVLGANPARGKKVRVKEQPKARGWLQPDQALALIDAAGELEAEARETDRYGRRAIVATLILAGPRVTELTQARRADLDLHGRFLKVGLKTDAGTDRTVELTWFLLGELRAWVASRNLKPTGPLVPTRTGKEHAASNVRRLLAQCRDRANIKREEAGLTAIGGVTPHWCRRTFATLCFLQGRDPRFVMSQIGHSDPRMTLSIYAQALSRRSFDRATVRDLMQFADEFETENETTAGIGESAETAR